MNYLFFGGSIWVRGWNFVLVLLSYGNINTVCYTTDTLEEHVMTYAQIFS